MANNEGESLIIPINSTDAFSSDLNEPVRGGGTRMVIAAPSGMGMLPILWISHKVTMSEDGKGTPVYNCLILFSKDPPVAQPGEIPVDALRSGNIPKVAVEW